MKLVFDEARIVRNEQRLGDSFVNIIHCAAALTAKMADELDAKWVLFNSQAEAKQGYKKVELDTDISSPMVRVLAGFKGNEKVLHLPCEKANRFVVMRSGDGKKKPRKLMLFFHLVYSGMSHELLEWLYNYRKEKVTIEVQEQEAPAGLPFDQPAKPADVVQMGAAAKPAAAPAPAAKKRGRPPKVAQEQPAPKPVPDPVDDAEAMRVATSEQRAEPIPSDDDAPEWRSSEELEAGVPHHIDKAVNGAPKPEPALASVVHMQRIGRH